jgi:glycosyltransferase involved in cell wall biosynthesis
LSKQNQATTRVEQGEYNPNIVVVFREPAPYMLACLKSLAQQSGREITIFCLPVNPEAPFVFENLHGLKLIDRSKYTAEELYNSIVELKPDLLFIADWSNLGFLRLAWKMRVNTVLVTGFDNHWTGAWKQRLRVFVASFFFPRLFRKVFIPGKPQRKLAAKLGFSGNQVVEGLYSADTALFNTYADSFESGKAQHFPHRFLCVARYIPAKGLDILWQAFAEAKAEFPNNWELWCAGTGALWDQRVAHPDIRHLGFIQPEQMGPIIAETGVFVLPSVFEPWGVVVHEYAAAGFPLLLSEAVGAASAFLNPDENGFSFPPADKEGLKAALLRIMKSSDEELYKMAKASRRLAAANSPEIWAVRLLDMGKSFSNE